MTRRLLVIASTLSACASAPRPPADLTARPHHIRVNLWREHTPTSQHPYRAPVCWHAAIDCGGGHVVRRAFPSTSAEASGRCDTRPGTEGADTWLRSANGAWEIRWPDECTGSMAEVYLSAQPGLDCMALHDHLSTVTRDHPIAQYVLQCHTPQEAPPAAPADAPAGD